MTVMGWGRQSFMGTSAGASLSLVALEWHLIQRHLGRNRQSLVFTPDAFRNGLNARYPEAFDIVLEWGYKEWIYSWMLQGWHIF